ncbi:MAG: Crp/Fnr family transcriptional regulator [Rhizobiaceae bacterium]
MWFSGTDLAEFLDVEALRELAGLKPSVFAKGSVLFRPGDEPQGFVILLSGRIGVYLTGPTGREIQLYSVVPGETCIQTTIGLVGDHAYTGEAVAMSDLSAVIVPRTMFSGLMDRSPAFRRFVFQAMGNRLGDVTRLLEQVAFVRIEQRLAGALLEHCGKDGIVTLTHQEIASIIGSAREVVSRRLELFSRQGLLALERGHIALSDRAGLERIADDGGQ